ncbi:hypothetical protein [Spartinivicinus ruber]|uniref:hypothetical protein n=1 Tax=Spartinivicinus ruber TaxID=2683272 RepID=UPI001E2AB4CD|nr:hypothetical protein [Spartinivicinus ruber]
MEATAIEPFEVVPTRAKQLENFHKDSLKVIIQGNNAPEKIYLDNKTISTHYNDTGKVFEVEIPYPEEDPLVPIKGFSYLIDYMNHKPKTYQLNTVCGGTIPIVAYAPDVWSLNIKFPKWGGRSVGRHHLNMDGTPTVQLRRERTTNFGREVSRTNTDLVTNTDTGVVGIQVAEDDTGGTPIQEKAKFGVELKCNNKKLEFNGLGWIKPVIKIGDQISELGRLFADLRSSFSYGWHLKWEVKFFEGTLEVEWKNVEDPKTNQVYSLFSCNVDILIASISCELGIGIQATESIYARLYFKLEVYSNIKINHTDKIGQTTKEKFIAAEFKVGAKPGVYVEAKASDFLEVKLSIETAMELVGDVKIYREPKGKFEAEMFLEVKDTELSWSVKLGTKQGEDDGVQPSGSEGEKYVIFKGNQFSLGKWPDDSDTINKYDPSKGFVEKSELEAMLVEAFHHYQDIRIKNSKSGYIYPIETIANKISIKIMQRNDIKRDAKAMEALVQEFDEILTKQSVHGIFIKFIEASDFEFFLESTSFQEILDKYVSPAVAVNNSIN